MTETTDPLPDLLRPFYQAAGRPKFRGEIWENAARVPMGVGYANENQPFDIETAPYLKPVFQAIRDHGIRKIVCKAAVQTLKSFVLDTTAAYMIEHAPGDMGFYLDDADKARAYAKGRLMPYLKKFPGIAKFITDLDRFDITTTEISLPGMNLRIWGLNEGNVQTFTLRYVFISDAYLAEGNGLIKQALARTTQHADDCKIIIESQGGVVGDNFDQEWETTNQAELHIKCPLCGAGQPFEWQKQRPDDFPIEKLRGTWAGMQRGDDNAVLFPDGEFNPSAVLAHTHYECFHCGGKILDTPENRAKIDTSSYYVPKNPRALPVNLGFTWPAWINRRIPWGVIMLEYLEAKRIQRVHGDLQPLIQWWQKRAAKSWTDQIIADAPTIAGEDYDPKSDWPEEKWRFLLVDCQQELAHFWYSAHGVAKNGESRQLERGRCLSFEDIVAIQKRWNIADQRVFLDGGYELTTLVEECAKHGHVHQKTGRWLCWNLLKGSALPSFNRHLRNKAGRVVGTFRHPVSDPVKYPVRMGDQTVFVHLYNWSNLYCKDMAARYRDGIKSPPCRFLKETEPITNELSWTAGLNSEHKTVERNKKTGLPTEIWKINKPGLANHPWDLLAMFMAVLLRANIAQVGAAQISQDVDSSP